MFLLYGKVTDVKSLFSRKSEEKGIHTDRCTYTHVFFKLDFSSPINYHHSYIHIFLMCHGLFLI